MSKLGLIMGVAGLMAASGEYQYDGRGSMAKQKSPELAWKRKKCKSCQDCGKVCRPNGKHKFSKPTNSACKDWKQKVELQDEGL